ncbi:MAG: DUF6782 family putative metallopeptidase [Pseudomonadota bacterium]
MSGSLRRLLLLSASSTLLSGPSPQAPDIQTTLIADAVNRDTISQGVTHEDTTLVNDTHGQSGADDPPVYVDLDKQVDMGWMPLSLWRRVHAEQTLHIAEEPSNVTEYKLDFIRDGLQRSASGAQLIQELIDTDVTLGDHRIFALDEGVGGVYTPALETVIAQTDAPRGQQIVITAHELRHAWQDKEGLLEGLSRRQSKAIETSLVFMLEADASAFSALVAWELKQIGDADAWDYLRDDSWMAPRLGLIERQAEWAEKTIGDPDQRQAFMTRTVMQLVYEGWLQSNLPERYADRVRDRLWRGEQALPTDLDARLGRVPGLYGSGQGGTQTASYLSAFRPQQAHDKAMQVLADLRKLSVQDHGQPTARSAFADPLAPKV